MPVMRGWLLLAVVVAVAACNDDDDTGQAVSTADNGPYALQADASWELQEAVDLADDDPIAEHDRPPLDWYAEYTRSSHTELVRLSGHDAALEESRAALEAIGFVFDEARVAGVDAALLGRSEIEQSGPSVLLLPGGTGTLLVLSYDVDPEDLTAFAASVETVGEDAWIAAGGVIR